MKHSDTCRSSGFSLVELAIVLVILGLLVGAILAGKSLIRASELRAVSNEYVTYRTAAHTFRDKYLYQPGDMNNAEQFWGQLHATAGTCVTTASTSTLTCNGDGDGIIEITSARSRESYRFWQHLVNAGLISGMYTGAQTGISTWSVALGTNLPTSRMSPGGWAVVSTTDVSTYGGWYLKMFPPSSQHWFEFGGATATGYLATPLLAPEEAWNIDTKLDDGLPGLGKITTFDNTQNTLCTTSATAATATYILTEPSKACTMMMGF